MGKRDVVDKSYFSESRRFAELINVLLYHGERIVLPENLILRRRKYPSLRSGCGEMERDVLMEDKGQNICYGMEIETESDYSMAERVMVYDACEYEYQVKELDRGHRDREDYADYREKKSRMKGSDRLLPMITAVLYLGEGHWKGSRRLSKMCGMSAKGRILLEKNFCDYDFPLAEADYVDPEAYKTDLKQFFQAMQCRKDRKKLKELFHTESFSRLGAETERAIAGHLHIKGLLCKIEKEGLPMCKAFNDLVEEERQAGRKEGKREEKLKTIRRMIKGGFDESVIRRMTNCTKEDLRAAVEHS